MATIKEELLVSGVRQVVVTCRRGTSVARSLKLLALALPYKIRRTTIILSTNRIYVISPYKSNTNFLILA